MSTPEALRCADALNPLVHYPEVDEAADMLRRQHAEIERLTACLETANANHEHFEREWYLRGDEIERLTAALDEARAERSVAYLAFEQVTAELDALRVANAAWREIGKSALCVLCALRGANDWHPNMIKDIDGVIDAVRSQGKEPGNG